MEGIILRGVGGFYTVLDGSGAVYTVRAQGKLRRQKLKPKIGDRCSFSPGEGEEDGWILELAPRKNELSRPPVANIDRICVVLAAGMPQPDLLLADRMVLNASLMGIHVQLVINKCDQDPSRAEEIAREYEGADVSPLCVSAKTGEGLDGLKAALRGTVHAFAGQSGAGKSSLINALYDLRVETGDLSRRIDRGKNTTRHCELICLEQGGMVLDTPGFSLLETPLTEPVTLKEHWPEFAQYEGKCFFSPCYHASEPRCAVLEAVEQGAISTERHARYLELLNDMRTRWRERYD